MELSIHGRLTVELRDAASGKLEHRQVNDNLITTAGLTVFAAGLNYSGIVDQAAAMGVQTATQIAPIYGAVGTGSVPPTALDTALTTELDRIYVTQSGAANGQVTWSFFFGVSDAVGTIAEAGVFSGATATPGSGILMDRVLFTPIIKTNTQTMTLSASFTLSAS